MIDKIVPSPPSREALCSWEGGAYQEFIEQHLADPSVDNRHFLMPRLLYSPAFTALTKACFVELKQVCPDRVAQKVASMLDNINDKGLAVEQNARQRNLANHISRACPRLTEYLGKERLQGFVSSYADTPFFWMNYGRSLAENFCLYLYWTDQCRDDSVFSSLLQFDGVSAGIGNRTARYSPWSGEEVMHSSNQELIHSETVSVSHALLEASGQLVSLTQLTEQRNKSGQLLSIQLMRDGSINALLLASLD